MATYSQATINAMNARGRNLLDPNKAKPPKPTPAKTFTTNGATTLGVGGSRASDYSTAPKVSSVISSVGLGNQKVGSSSGSTSGGSVSTTSIDPLTPEPPIPPIPPGGGGIDTTANDFYADQLAAQEEAARIRKEAALAANNAYIPQVNTYADKRLQDAYISKELNRVNLPQQLSALGYSGGATETSMMDAQAGYENRRNSIEEDRGRALGDIRQNAAQIEATGNADLADMSAQYYQNMIAKAQRDGENALSQSRWQTEFNSDQQSEAYQNQLDMAKLKASYGDYSGLQALGISVNALNDANGSTPSTKAYSARTASSGSANYETGTQNVNYYSEADRILRQRTVPSSQVALIREWNTQGKLSDTQAEALLKKYGLI
jgi:hypothetical protein